jgi:hypothetical protein
MNTKTTIRDKRRTTMVPVTTMEEIPVLSEAERDELLKSLKEGANPCQSGADHRLRPEDLQGSADRYLPAQL